MQVLELLCLYASSSRYSVVKIALHASVLLRHGRPSSRLYPRAFSKLDAYQSEDQDILFLLQFEYLCHVFSSLSRLISSGAFELQMTCVYQKIHHSMFNQRDY